MYWMLVVEQITHGWFACKATRGTLVQRKYTVILIGGLLPE